MSDRHSDLPDMERRGSSRSRSPPQNSRAPVRDRPNYPKPNKSKDRVAQRESRIMRQLAEYQNTQGVGKSISDLSNIKPKFDGKGKLFPHIDDDEPDFMQRISADSRGSDFNWMARQSSMDKFNAFIGKTALDPDSLAAFCNTLSQLSLKTNTKVASFRIEFIPDHYVQEHHDDVEKLRAKVQGSMAPTELQRQETPIEIEDDEESSQVAEASSNLDSNVFCGNTRCKRQGHTVAQCVMPDPTTGLVYGCPLCNAGDHLVDSGCPKTPPNDSDNEVYKQHLEKLIDVLFVKRANKPSFATTYLVWPLILHSYVKDAKAFEEYEDLDRSVWDTRGNYPWTHHYGMKMSNTKEKRNKLRAYDPVKGTPRLPRDPFFKELGTKSLSQTIRAFNDGKWNLAVACLPGKDTPHLSRSEYLAEKAYAMVSSDEFHIRAAPGQPAPKRPASFPTPTLVHNALKETQFEWCDKTNRFEIAPTWKFAVSDPDKIHEVLTRHDPEADYGLEYAKWKVKHSPELDEPLGDTQEFLGNRDKLDRQADERRRARAAEDGWAGL
ncbi:hypothetical protein QBC45DRAFT_470454 [Copromyces sp. CBS 386.78]|nr:hypothetical protein QBC45DRAFT_470454 [Copromyces sp. CBS 386.78]